MQQRATTATATAAADTYHGNSLIPQSIEANRTFEGCVVEQLPPKAKLTAHYFSFLVMRVCKRFLGNTTFFLLCNVNTSSLFPLTTYLIIIIIASPLQSIICHTVMTVTYLVIVIIGT